MEENNNYQLTWLPKKTFEILAIISWKEVEEARKKAISEAAKEVEIKGFRKGKAPEDLVVKSIGNQKLLELALENIIPGIYQKAVNFLKLNPILTPKIEVVEAKENADWKVRFTSCEEPEVKLGNYKEELKKIKVSEKIWTPGKGVDPGKNEGKIENAKDKKDEKLQKTIEWILQNIKPEISDLLIENEVNRKLSNLLDQVQKLGLTIDQYLASSGKSAENLRQEYQKSAYETISLEIVLNKIAEVEKVVVKPEEIDKTIAEVQDEKERKNLESQKYLLATLIRRQKTLDFLANL